MQSFSQRCTQIVGPIGTHGVGKMRPRWAKCAERGQNVKNSGQDKRFIVCGNSRPSCASELKTEANRGTRYFKLNSTNSTLPSDAKLQTEMHADRRADRNAWCGQNATQVGQNAQKEGKM